MTTVAPGYSRPVQQAPVPQAIEAIIAEACPGSRVAPWGDAPNKSASWGPWLSTDTGHATDEAVRHIGSSGGAISALAIHALRSGLVDRVLHVLADPEYPTRNLIKISRIERDVVSGAGSRYAASSPLAEIGRELDAGGALAFIGKPCDVSALRQLAKAEPRVGRHVPLMLSFFCGGIPSHAGADRVIRAMGLEPAEVAAFRYRGNGWPGKAAAITQAGTVGEMSYAESWGDYLSHEVQFRCKICPDAVGGVADITCADAWYGGEAGYPTFEELDGRSLIMARTEAGARFLAGAVASGELATTSLDIRDVDLMQPSQASRKRLVRARLAALTATLQPRPQVDGLLIEAAAKTATMRDQLRNFLGTIRRVLIGKR